MEYCMRRTHPSILAALAACVVSVVPAFATQAAVSAGWTIQASMPTPRGELAVVRGNSGALYALGGANASGVLATVEAYNPMANRWVMRAALPTARADLGAAFGGDGRIYAIGGVPTGGGWLRTVEAYTPSTNTWSEVAPLPRAIADLAAATSRAGTVYAIGGVGYADPSHLTSTVLATVYAYTPSTGSWQRAANMPTARRYLGAATATDGRLFAIGGSDGYPSGGSYLGNVEAYTP